MSRSLIAALSALALACCASAQNANGILDGRVTDSSGAAITGANVTIENQGTGTKQEFTTNSEGRFYKGQVLIGRYRVTVEHPGFQKYIQNDIPGMWPRQSPWRFG